jgi:PKD repeat protein
VPNDPDGDSLSYAFGESFQSIGTPVQYIPPFSANYPFSFWGAPNLNAPYPQGMHIDPVSGDIKFRPFGVFVSQLVIEVTQWKLVSGVRINVGKTRRDVQFQTILCTNSNPNYTPIIKVFKEGILQTNFNFVIEGGKQICLDISALDQSSSTILADTTDLKLNNPTSYIPVMANATFTRNYILSQRQVQGPMADSFKFCWTPPLGAIRTTPYLFTITGYDRFCPLKGLATKGIAITVSKPKSISIDSTTKKIFCNNRITTTNVNYKTSSINLLSGNVFTAQLSDSSGSFTNATAIGNKASTDTVGFIPLTIPTGLFVNSNYKIRINASSDTVNLGTPFSINFVAGFNTPVITTNKDSLCKGLVSTFKVTPNTAGLSFKWLKNNVLIANQTKDSLLVDSAFTYRAIVSNTGCSDTSNAKYLTVFPKPSVGFTTNNISQCVNGNNFIFTDTSKIATGSISRLWTLNNTDTSTNITTNKSFANIGTYTIKLLVISNNGCKDSISKSVSVNPKPNVGFTINNAAQCLNGNSFLFTDTTKIASGTLVRKWNLGTGANDTSIIVNPTKTYYVPNTYTIKIVAASNNGCKDSLTKTITVHPKPAVYFMINNASQCLKDNSFSFADSTNIPTGTFTRKWNLGMGINDTANSASPTKTYATANTYAIKLVATSNNNCKDSMTANVTVNNNATANFNIINASQCLKGNNFSFTNTSTNANAQTWSFGDASNSTALSPTKTYINAGSYNVKLLAKNALNCNDSITKTVVVNPQPVAAFTVNNATQCLNGNNFIFTDNSSIATGTLNRLWLFDNTDTSTNVSVNKTYTALGTHNIKLTVKSGNNCVDTTSKTVTVLPKVTIGTILGNAAPNSISTPYAYSVLSQPNVVYNWTATNGTIQSGQGTNTVSLVWTSAGSGKIKAEISNTSNCTDTTTLPVNITTVGINNLSLDNDLKVYPNPTKNSITITNKSNLVGKKYIITNLVGQTVITGKLNLDETIVNLETLQSGVYLLSIDGMNKQSIKVIKE